MDRLKSYLLKQTTDVLIAAVKQYNIDSEMAGIIEKIFPQYTFRYDTSPTYEITEQPSYPIRGPYCK